MLFLQLASDVFRTTAGLDTGETSENEYTVRMLMCDPMNEQKHYTNEEELLRLTTQDDNKLQAIKIMFIFITEVLEPFPIYNSQ